MWALSVGLHRLPKSENVKGLTQRKEDGRHTKNFAGLAYTTNDVFLFDRVAHWDFHVAFKALSQSESVIVVAFGGNVQNSAHA